MYFQFGLYLKKKSAKSLFPQLDLSQLATEFLIR